MYSEERSRFIQGGMNVKHDCFAFDKYLRKCKALNELYCLHGKCAFYKTAEERCKGCRDAKGRALTCEQCKKEGLK